MTTQKQTWQFQFAAWVGAARYGLMFGGARRNARGPWLAAEQLPAAVRDYLSLKRRRSATVPWVCPAFKSLDAFRKGAHVLRLQRTGTPQWVKGLAEIPVPVEERLKPPVVPVDLDRLAAEIREQNDGRNLDCWPVFSFGGKDADLDPEGCTGIRRLVGVSGRHVRVEVGGHKTFGDPSEDFELDEEARVAWQESAHVRVCDAGWGDAGHGEWTGDDWSFAFSLVIRVPLRIRYPGLRREGGVLRYDRTAAAVIAAAAAACAPYEAVWAAIDRSLEELYQEIQAVQAGEELPDETD